MLKKEKGTGEHGMLYSCVCLFVCNDWFRFGFGFEFSFGFGLRLDCGLFIYFSFVKTGPYPEKS